MHIAAQPARELLENLNRASEIKRYYPYDKHVVDWSVPIDDRHLYIPEDYSVLAGTYLWNRLSLPEKSFVTRWEMTQLLRNNSIGEHLLNQALLSMLFHVDFYHPVYRYMLHEVAEECQHMAMFNEWVRRNPDVKTKGAGQHKWGLAASVLTPMLATRFPPLFFVLVILFEVLGDEMARNAMQKPNLLLHPIIHQLNKAHVIEEARHVAFAREWLTNVYPKMSRTERLMLSEMTERILSRLLRIGIPLPYSRQLTRYLSYSEFQSALGSPHRRALVRNQVTNTARLLAGTGIVRAKAMQKLERSLL